MFPRARTVVAHSRARLHEFLAGLKPTPDRTLLFALSSNAWDQSILQRLASLGSHSVGCISAPLPGSRHLETLSLAFVRESSATTMRWEHPEAAPSSDDWAADALGHDAPQAKDESSTFNIDNPNLSPAAHTIVAFSTKPHAVSFHDSIARRYPHALQLGLVGSYTPFVNGSLFTLFRDGHTYTTGAVAVAVSGSERPRVSFKLHGFHAITPPVRVASARGNIIHTLGRDSATRYLLLAIHRSGLDVDKSDEEEFYLALYPRGFIPPTAEDAPLRVDAAAYDAVLKINSGDPSRGPIAVESEWGPSTGDYVQILHRSLNDLPSHSLVHPAWPGSDEPELRLSATTLEEMHEGHDLTDGAQYAEMENVFEASSENGFVTYSGARSPWYSACPGISTTLRWT